VFLLYTTCYLLPPVDILAWGWDRGSAHNPSYPYPIVF